MQKMFFLLLFLFTLAAQQFPVQAQNLYETRQAKMTFFSSTPIEDISASSNKGTSVIDIAKGEIAFVVLVNTFEFPNSLMQQHFNENYIESKKYPKAIFKGKFAEKLDPKNPLPQKVNIKGELEIHGVKRTRTIPAEVTFKDGKIIGKSKFKVRVADHDIKIPSIVFKNIAEEVEVSIEGYYTPLKI